MPALVSERIVSAQADAHRFDSMISQRAIRAKLAGESSASSNSTSDAQSCPTNPPSPPASPGTRTPPDRGRNIRRSTATASADVVIIGGGFTGLSAAAHLAKAGIDVVLIEAHRFGDGASGRNGGQLGTGQRAWAEELEARIRLHARQGAVRSGRGGQGTSAGIRRGQRHRDRLSCRARCRSRTRSAI